MCWRLQILIEMMMIYLHYLKLLAISMSLLVRRINCSILSCHLHDKQHFLSTTSFGLEWQLSQDILLEQSYWWKSDGQNDIFENPMSETLELIHFSTCLQNLTIPCITTFKYLVYRRELLKQIKAPILTISRVSTCTCFFIHLTQSVLELSLYAASTLWCTHQNLE